MRRILLITILFAIACYDESTNPPNVEGRISPGNQRALFQRASFDLNCNAGSITLVRMYGQTVGADGCGRRATYVWVQRDNYGGEWIRE